jgi:hypothetical protein
MTLPWKILVAGLALYSMVLTWAFLHMVGYLQRLHFFESDRVRGLTDTVPGLQITVTLSIVGAILVSATLLAFGKHRDPADPVPPT